MMHKIKSLGTVGRGKSLKWGKYMREARGKTVKAGVSFIRTGFMFARKEINNSTKLKTLWQKFKQASGNILKGAWCEVSVSWVQ